jgi:hypothetical protein
VFSTDQAWAMSAIATLIAAPAVPDMATQVRCPKCGHVFAQCEVRYLRAGTRIGTTAIVWIVVTILFLWAIYQLIRAWT